jgi:hypothetical protein
MLKLKFRLLVAAVALAPCGYALAAADMVAEMDYCTKASVFAEVFTNGKLAQKSNDDSVASAVAALNATYKDKISEQDLKLLLPWAVMVDKLRGYQPTTGGALVAISCFTFLKDGKYLQMGSPSVIASVRAMLDACETHASADAVGQCIKTRYIALPLDNEK